MTFVVRTITRYIVTYFAIIRYFGFIVWHCVVASTLYYDKKTPKSAQASDGPPSTADPRKKSVSVFFD